MPSKRDRTCRRCPAPIDRQNRSGLCAKCYNASRAAAKPDALLAADREKQTLRFELQTTKRKLEASEREAKRLTRENAAIEQLGETNIGPVVIPPSEGTNTSEGTVVLVASDWHVEETVDPSKVSQLNEFNTDVATARVGKFFRAGLNLTNMLRQNIKIKTILLPLLGDFITNDIHDEFPELNALAPMHAVQFAEGLIVGGITYLLEHGDYNIEAVAHSGNHARTTRQCRFSNENGHSLEYLMYRHIAKHFEGEKRVRFTIADGYHSYVTIYDQTLRLHHGHAINYQGGIGGIFIPAFKAISQWDKARRADLDIFGHFHQHKDGGKFVSNGSLIGFNSYALSIKADYEPPRQTLLLIDKKRGRTCTWPVLVQ